MTDQATPSIKIKLTSVLVGLLSFASFTYLRGSDFGAMAAFAVLAISVAAYCCWYLHRKPHFWPLLIVVAVGHIAFLARTDLVLPKPTIVLAPIVFIDFIVIVVLLIGVGRMFDRTTD